MDMAAPPARKRNGPGTAGGRRKRVAPSRKVLRILKAVKAHLESTYGDGVRQVILYGSQARGDATEASDVDVAVIVGDSLDPREVERSLDELLGDVLLDEMELVAVIAYNEAKFARRSSPHIMSIKAEGLVI
jgi:predicted nucleotidyltransferase